MVVPVLAEPLKWIVVINSTRIILVSAHGCSIISSTSKLVGQTGIQFQEPSGIFWLTLKSPSLLARPLMSKLVMGSSNSLALGALYTLMSNRDTGWDWPVRPTMHLEIAPEYELKPKRKMKCMLPSCQVLTDHHGGYCSAEHCREHKQTKKAENTCLISISS